VGEQCTLAEQNRASTSALGKPGAGRRRWQSLAHRLASSSYLLARSGGGAGHARPPAPARAPDTRRRAPPCLEPASAPLGRALPQTSPPPLTPGPFSRRPIRGPPRPLQLRPYCTVPGGSQAVVPRELCQRLELRAAARREQRLSACGMRRSKTPSWDPSAERRSSPGSTKTLLRRNGTDTPHLEIIALIFQCQLKRGATEVNCGDHERDHAWKHQR